MEIPYSYSLHHYLEPVSETADRLPHWASLSIPSAQSVKHFKAQHVDFIVQRITRKPFVVEAIEVNAGRSISFSIEIKEKIILLFFLIKGHIIFTNNAGQITAAVRGNHFFLTQNQPGLYQSAYQAGRHISVMVTISKKWMSKTAKIFPNLSEEIQRFLGSEVLSITMPIIRMDKRVHLLIRELYNRATKNAAALDGLLRLYMAELLEHYNTLLESGGRLLPFKLKRYLDLNYTNPELNTSFLSRHFNITERTLRNQFQQSFHTTIHSYYTGLRLQLANRLLAQGESVKDIYQKIGYHTERGFRYALTRAQPNKPVF